MSLKEPNEEFSMSTAILLSSAPPSNRLDLAAMMACMKAVTPVEFHPELCCINDSGIDDPFCDKLLLAITILCFILVLMIYRYILRSLMSFVAV